MASGRPMSETATVSMETKSSPMPSMSMTSFLRPFWSTCFMREATRAPRDW
ncbi:hypothetical protein D3C87_1784430 [compost metagenome]